METIQITPAGQGKHYLVGTDVISIKAAGSNTSDTMLVFEIVVPPGGGPPTLHRHAYSEVFRVLEGEFEATTLGKDGRPIALRVGVGDTLSIPSMVWHNFKNPGAVPARLIVVHSSTVMEGFLLELGVPIEDPTNPPRPDGPPTPEQMQHMMQIIGKYMEVMAPTAASR